MSGLLRWGAATDAGRVRDSNEDAFLAEPMVFAVADGMGGHQAGEVASAMAVDVLRQRLIDGAPSVDVVVAAVVEANAAIFQTARRNTAQMGMGTTVTVLAVLPAADAATTDTVTTDTVTTDTVTTDTVTTDTGATDTGAVDTGATDTIGIEDTVDVEPSAASGTGATTEPAPAPPGDPVRLALANVGDSRTYILRAGVLARATVDHSYVQELLATGHLTEDEARNHPRRNIVTRALGIEPNVRVDSWLLPLVRGDRFVLCSDGLVDEIDDTRIGEIATSTDDPQTAAERLVAAALEHGGRDNVTVIVVDVVEGSGPGHGASTRSDTEPTRVMPLVTAGGVAADPIVAAPPPRSRVRGPQMTGRLFAFVIAVAVVLTAVVTLLAVALSGDGTPGPSPTSTTTSSTTTPTTSTLPGPSTTAAPEPTASTPATTVGGP